MDWHFLLNIAVALVLGIAIGIERQFRQHTAGLRTNALVCVGAALFVTLSRLEGHESSPTRIAAQVVRGMNTAATLWCSAAVGSLAGAGFLVEGTIGTGTVLFIHLALRPLVRKIETMTKTVAEIETLYRLRVACAAREEGVVRLVLMRHV